MRLWLLLPLAACLTDKGPLDSADPGEESDADADADTDIDADADADTDVDTDTDADTDVDTDELAPVVITSLTGSVDFATILDGVPQCDLGIALTLDPDAAEQQLGDWAAGVLSSVVRNDGDAACETGTFLPEDRMFSLFDPSGERAMGLAYSAQEWDSGRYLYSYATAVEGTESELLASQGKDERRAPGDLMVNTNWPPDELQWESAITFQIPEGPNLWYDDCGAAVPASDADQAVGTTVDEYQRIYAHENTLDVWTLVLSEADTVSLRVASDYEWETEPLLWINDAAGCTLIEARANVACNEEDAAIACPALVIVLEPGMYEVVVSAASPLRVNYELWSDLTFGLLELTGDDVKATAERTYEITASGSVSVAWEYK